MYYALAKWIFSHDFDSLPFSYFLQLCRQDETDTHIISCYFYMLQNLSSWRWKDFPSWTKLNIFLHHVIRMNVVKDYWCHVKVFNFYRCSDVRLAVRRVSASGWKADDNLWFHLISLASFSPTTHNRHWHWWLLKYVCWVSNVSEKFTTEIA